MKTKCAAIQMSDQMVCNQCQLSWDMNDIDVPVSQAKGEDGNMVNRVEPSLVEIGVSTRVNMVRDMTLRDHFAAVALSELFGLPTLHMSSVEKAEYCYGIADAMMKQRLK